MPKVGFKSITLPETVYNTMKKDYESKKLKLQSDGVFSFAAYMTLVYTKYMEKLT